MCLFLYYFYFSYWVVLQECVCIERCVEKIDVLVVIVVIDGAS